MTRTLSRRTLLRGAGVAIGLPALEAMSPRRAAAATSPVRFVGWFHPNGINDDRWTPAAEGAGFTLPANLVPLAKVRDHLLVISGLKIADGNVGSHAGGQTAFLTASRTIQSGVTTSLDQVIAARTAPMTRFPSLQMSIEVDGGYAGFQDRNRDGIADSPTESFDDTKDRCFGPDCRIAVSKGSTLPNFYNPRLVFERLFGATAGTAPTGTPVSADPRAAARRFAYRRSVLEYASEDARRLQARLGTTDRLRLDEYLTGVREIEKQIERLERAPVATSQGCTPGTKPVGVATDPVQRTKLFADMMVKAFQCDATRACTLMLGNNTSRIGFVVDGATFAHHDASHWSGDAGKRKAKDGIDVALLGALAHFLEALKAVPEGTGSMLDNVVVYFSSDIADPNRHDHVNMPVLLAGRGGGAFTTGRHVRARDRQTGDLFLTILEAFGIAQSKFGDFGSARLAGLG